MLTVPAHRLRPSLSLLLASVMSCVLFAAAASAAPTSPSPSPSATNSAAPGLGSGGEGAATTVGIRTATSSQPDDRGSYTYEIAPGAYQVDYVAITNFSTHPVDVRVLSEDATSSGDTAYAPVTGTQRGVGAWTTLGTGNITIPAHSVQIVPFQISVPRNATPGDHPGAIIVSLLASQPKPQGGQVVVDHRVGLRVALRVPGALTPKLEIVNMRSDFTGFWSGFGVGRMQTTYEIRNSGNVTLSGDEAAKYVRSLFLSDVPLKVAPVTSILPGGSFRVSVGGPRMFALGPVDTEVSVHATNTKDAIKLPMVTATVTTWVIPWIPVWLLVAIAALWLGKREWRRRHPRKTGRRAAAPAPRRLKKLVRSGGPEGENS